MEGLSGFAEILAEADFLIRKPDETLIKIREGVIMEAVNRRILTEALSCEDLSECGRRVAAFARMALESAHRDILIQLYYNWLMDIHKEDLIFKMGEPSYKLFSGEQASLRYLAHNSPARCGTVRTLRRLKDLGVSMSQGFHLSPGPQIEEEDIQQAMEYLEEEFGLNGKVFHFRGPCFIRLGQSHQMEHSHWRITQNDMGSTISVFFYPCCFPKEEPIQMLFRQLADICCYRFRSERDDLARAIQDEIESWCCPDVDLLTERRKEALVVEGICQGLMQGSPFEEGDISSNTNRKRYRLKTIVQQMLRRL